MHLVHAVTDYIVNSFQWATIVERAHGEATEAQEVYLDMVELIATLEDFERIAIFKKLPKHADSDYWYHYLYFKHFLRESQQMALFNELMQESKPRDAKMLIQEIGTWSPEFQRQFLSLLEMEDRNKLFNHMGAQQIIELSVQLAESIRNYPHTFKECYA